MDDLALDKCPRCFAELREPWQFCPSCGLPLDPALSSESGATSTRISYVSRPVTPLARRRPTLRESLTQSVLHLLVLASFVGIVAGGLMVLNPDLLAWLTSRPEVEVAPQRAPPSRVTRGPTVTIDEIKFVLIPRGWIRTGDPDTWEGRDHEQVRTPDIDRPFGISRYEITNFQYFEYLEYRRDTFGFTWTNEGPARYWTRNQDHMDNPMPDDLQWDEPVRGVSFTEARQFCTWLGQQRQEKIRLPYWYEWEKAARGKDGLIYPWGDKWENGRCNTREVYFAGPVAGTVYGREATDEDGQSGGDVSPYGVLNMAGNVSEWADTHFSTTKYIMGGAFNCEKEDARTWCKIPYGQTFHLHYVGFRVVREDRP
jgi:formylglycine-generating enzyme required for sulfatase activity